MALPQIHIRVVTKKGKDMVKMLDGRWATVLSENATHIKVEVDDHEYLDWGPYAPYAGYFSNGKKVTLDLDKRIVEDKRAEILQMRRGSKPKTPCDSCKHRKNIENPQMQHYAFYCKVKRVFCMKSQKTCKYYIQKE